MSSIFTTDLAIEDWAFRAGNRYDLWTEFVRRADVRTLLEVGVWKGDFACKILSQSSFIHRYYMIDPWAKLSDWNKPLNVGQRQFDEVFAEAMHKTAFAKEKVVVLRGRTKEVIDEIPDGSLDFAYIDGDHTLRGITIDLIKVFPKIRWGGFIGGDDFSISPWQHSASFEPTLVCPFSVYFAEAMDMPIAALPFQQFLIAKSESTFCFEDLVNRYGDLSLNRFPSSNRWSWIRSKVRSTLRMFGLRNQALSPDRPFQKKDI